MSASRAADRRRERAIGARLLLSALLAALAFPPASLGPLILVALVPLVDAVALAEAAPPAARRRASLLLYLGGVLHFALLLYWVLFLPPEEVTVPGLIFLAFPLLAGYLGLFVLGAQAVARRGARAGLPLAIGLPVAWVAGEYLRSLTQLAFPWALLGYGLIETPVLLQFMSATGIFGASLLVALTNGLVWAALRGRGRRRLLPGGLAALILLAAYGHGRAALERLGPAPTREVLIVQGNIGRGIKFKPELRHRNVERMIALSDEGLSRGPADLVIWGETAAPCYLRHDAVCLALIQTFVDRTGVPLLTGVPDAEVDGEGGERRWNAAVVVAPGRGIVARYEKVNLVPFGEAIPYQERIPFLEAIEFGEADFRRGSGFHPIAAAGESLGVMICFESIFPAIGRRYARAGASFLVNITNDEWFGKSGGPHQHAAMAVARAIETRRGLARCANTGASFVVDRAGRRSPPTPLFAEALVRAPVELGSGATGYMRVGDLVGQLCLGAAVGMGVAGRMAAGRGRAVGGRRRPGGGDPER